MKNEHNFIFELKTAITCIALFSVLTAPSGCTRQPVHPSPTVSGDAVVIDISSLKPETPEFFTYQHEGKNLSFFVLKLGDRVNSFLDACATCYRHKRGYSYRDGSVVCRFCSMRFSVYTLEKGLGGCYPIKVQGRMEKDRYLIPLTVLKAEAGKF